MGPERALHGGVFAIETASVAALWAALDDGRLTVRQLVQSCLDRIAAMDRTGPSLHAVIETNRDALAIADRLDAERARGEARGPLHGIPVLLKDNVATADEMQTTAGSLALAGQVPTRDAFVAQRLHEAGAVILGKTNLSEWANFRSSHSSSGWSGRGGQTRNPYQLDRTPSGSSSGSAVAVAAGYAPLAIGTETDGSIVSPATACGVVGIKPTVGLTSRTGVIPIAHSQDTVGPMARSVADAAALLTVFAGRDLDDPAHDPASTLPGSFPIVPEDHLWGRDYTQALDRDGLRGARIGVVRSRFTFSPTASVIAERALEVLREAGAELVDPVDIPTAKEIGAGSGEITVLLTELKAGLAAYFATYTPDGPVRALADVIRFNSEHAAEELPYFGQNLLERAEATAGLADLAYIDALLTNQRLSRAEGLDKALDEHHLDALIAPTGSPATRIDLINGDHFIGASAQPAALAGYPLLTVPAGYHFGLPVGISFMGRAYSEATLIRLAYAYEQAAGVWRAPEYEPHRIEPAAEYSLGISAGSVSASI